MKAKFTGGPWDGVEEDTDGFADEALLTVFGSKEDGNSTYKLNKKAGLWEHINTKEKESCS